MGERREAKKRNARRELPSGEGGLSHLPRWPTLGLAWVWGSVGKPL